MESKLGTGRVCFYGEHVIQFLRFVGVLTAAIWLGAVAFQTFVAGPALSSADALGLIGSKSFPYFSTALAQIVTTRYFFLGSICAFVALAHMFVENLYMGRGVSRRWLALLLTLFALNLLGNSWLNPKLVELHKLQHQFSSTPATRAAAARSFGVWQGVFQAMNVLMLAGVTAYLWRVSHPTDTPRFVTSGKFRG